MKNYQLGLLLGGIFLITIVVTNIIAPHAFPDDRITMPFTWGLIALVLILCGYRAGRKNELLERRLKREQWYRLSALVLLW